MNTEQQKGPWWVHLSFETNRGGFVGFFWVCSFSFLKLSLHLYRTLLVFADIAGEFSLGWLRPVGNAKEIPFPSINAKGEAHLAKLSLTPQGMPLLLVRNQEENLKEAVDKSAVTESKTNTNGVPQSPNPPKTGNTIPTTGEQAEPDILGQALQMVNKELS